MNATISPGKARGALSLACGTGVRPVVNTIAPMFEATTGRRVDVAYAPWPAMRDELLAGRPFDAVLMTAGDVDALIAGGKIVESSRRTVARSLLGACVKAGATKPDISTMASFAAALDRATSIGYSDGPSGNFFMKILEGHGLDKALSARLVKVPATREMVAAAVARGLAQIGVQQIPEILPVSGADLVGPLPPEAQSVILQVTGVATPKASAGGDPAGVEALVSYLCGPEAAAVIRDKGMEPAV
jgi:molybdate transport system substrate-binding protein